jgi:DNA-binding IclR family transcriptional regulator
LIGSVQRALRLLDIVGASSRPLTVKALAGRSGLSIGTTYNLVRTLIHEGYLQADQDGVILGPRFPGLSETGADGIFLAQVRQTLSEVSTEFGAAAYLARFTDGEVAIVDIVDAPCHPRAPLWVGIQDSAHATALGKQILATLDQPGKLDYLSRHPPAELTPNTISDTRTLLMQLERCSGVAVDRQEYALGTSCLAVPVITPGLRAALAISLTSGDSRIDDPGGIADRLRSAAGRLSLRLAAHDAAHHPAPVTAYRAGGSSSENLPV